MEPRFDKTQPNLCPCLRWKGMYISAEQDPTVMSAGDTAFWCRHTQNSLGLDGELAEPGNCNSPKRECYRREMAPIEA